MGRELFDTAFIDKTTGTSDSKHNMCKRAAGSRIMLTNLVLEDGRVNAKVPIG